jgi:hypothetical protein
MKLLAILVTNLALTGCWWTNPPLPPVIPDGKVIQVDPRAFEPCLPLKPLNIVGQTDTNAALQITLGNVKDNAAVYVDCRNKQDASISTIKKLTNKETK